MHFSKFIEFLCLNLCKISSRIFVIFNEIIFFSKGLIHEKYESLNSFLMEHKDSTNINLFANLSINFNHPHLNAFKGDYFRFLDFGGLMVVFTLVLLGSWQSINTFASIFFCKVLTGETNYKNCKRSTPFADYISRIATTPNCKDTRISKMCPTALF